jgi:signal transduction histidine kinase
VFYTGPLQAAVILVNLGSYLTMAAITGDGPGAAIVMMWFAALCGVALLANLPARQLHRRLNDLEVANAQLAELDQLKRDFIANSSHELRTPLTVAHGLAKTLDTRWEDIDDRQRREFIARITANAEELGHMVDLLLDFAKLEGGRLQPERRPFDLSALVLDHVERVRPLLGERTLALAVQPALIVNADPSLIGRVVTNLLANAATHTDPAARVSVRVSASGGLARVEVGDDGPGVPAEELPHLGERFYRGGDVDSRGKRGTGLGLAFSREILALHGSALEISSRRGRGSRFGFALQLAGPPGPPAASGSQRAESAPNGTEPAPAVEDQAPSVTPG